MSSSSVSSARSRHGGAHTHEHSTYSSGFEDPTSSVPTTSSSSVLGSAESQQHDRHHTQQGGGGRPRRSSGSVVADMSDPREGYHGAFSRATSASGVGSSSRQRQPASADASPSSFVARSQHHSSSSSAYTDTKYTNSGAPESSHTPSLYSSSVPSSPHGDGKSTEATSNRRRELSAESLRAHAASMAGAVGKRKGHATMLCEDGGAETSASPTGASADTAVHAPGSLLASIAGRTQTRNDGTSTAIVNIDDDTEFVIPSTRPSAAREDDGDLSISPRRPMPTNHFVAPSRHGEVHAHHGEVPTFGTPAGGHTLLHVRGAGSGRGPERLIIHRYPPRRTDSDIAMFARRESSVPFGVNETPANVRGSAAASTEGSTTGSSGNSSSAVGGSGSENHNSSRGGLLSNSRRSEERYAYLSQWQMPLHAMSTTMRPDGGGAGASSRRSTFNSGNSIVAAGGVGGMAGGRGTSEDADGEMLLFASSTTLAAPPHVASTRQSLSSAPVSFLRPPLPPPPHLHLGAGTGARSSSPYQRPLTFSSSGSASASAARTSSSSRSSQPPPPSSSASVEVPERASPPTSEDPSARPHGFHDNAYAHVSIVEHAVPPRAQSPAPQWSRGPSPAAVLSRGTSASSAAWPHPSAASPLHGLNASHHNSRRQLQGEAESAGTSRVIFRYAPSSHVAQINEDERAPAGPPIAADLFAAKERRAALLRAFLRWRGELWARRLARVASDADAAKDQMVTAMAHCGATPPSEVAAVSSTPCGGINVDTPEKATAVTESCRSARSSSPVLVSSMAPSAALSEGATSGGDACGGRPWFAVFPAQQRGDPPPQRKSPSVVTPASNRPRSELPTRRERRGAKRSTLPTQVRGNNRVAVDGSEGQEAARLIEASAASIGAEIEAVLTEVERGRQRRQMNHSEQRSPAKPAGQRLGTLGIGALPSTGGALQPTGQAAHKGNARGAASSDVLAFLRALDAHAAYSSYRKSYPLMDRRDLAADYAAAAELLTVGLPPHRAPEEDFGPPSRLQTDRRVAPSAVLGRPCARWWSDKEMAEASGAVLRDFLRKHPDALHY